MHPWMDAKMFVFDHPYFAVTDDNGRFTIDKAPAGPCRLVVWHEDGGWLGGNKQGIATIIEADKAADLGKLLMKKRKQK